MSTGRRGSDDRARPKTVTEPLTYYQVRAVGAVIQDVGRPEAGGE